MYGNVSSSTHTVDLICFLDLMFEKLTLPVCCYTVTPLVQLQLWWLWLWWWFCHRGLFAFLTNRDGNDMN